MVKKSVNLLPTFFRTDKNIKFLSSTLDQLIKDPELKRLDGFVGSKLSKNYDPSSDQYITFDQPLRNRYQLEPGLIIKELDGSIAKAYGYDDLINQLSYHKASVDNLNKLFQPDFYSFDPQVDWDKLINFRNYFWLPTGPAAIKITGTQRELVSTFTVTDSTDGDFFIFTPDGLTSDPQITLYRGVTYVFNVNSKQKFYIRDTEGYGTTGLYNAEVLNNGTSNGQVIITVSTGTPSVLFYATETDQYKGGQFVIKTIDENSSINVESEIVGKESYTSGTGIKFVNGLKVKFGGDVLPASYRNTEYIVEGVGDKIKLVDFSYLDTPEIVATQYDVDFDAENFDDFPFDNFKNIPIEASYITINRASKDLNPWARYNRWFHADVLEAVATASGEIVEFPNSVRASRPIIEFKPDLQLFNFGNTAVRNVDLIDNFTTDVFSDVEKSIGYWVDDVLLAEGYRVIFNADPDPLVRGRIYEVRFTPITDPLTNKTERYINLVETDDNIPALNACVTVTAGANDGKKVWWFTTVNGVNKWVEGQQRTTQNQAPLFDVFDSNGYSYSSTPYTSDFRGTKLFGYAVGTGTADAVLGFPLIYKSVGVESSYLFYNYFNTDKIIRVFPDQGITIPVSVGFLKSNTDALAPNYLNIWTDAAEYKLPVVQLTVSHDAVDQIEITTFDNPGWISDIEIAVFVDDIKFKPTAYSIVKDVERLFVQFTDTIPASLVGSRIRLDIYSDVAPNSTGVYQTPINLTNNPLNGPVSELILSELYDHVSTMVDRDPNFTGTLSGKNNLNSLPFATQYGTRIVANKNPLSLAHYFISNKENNLIEAIKHGGEDYNQYKLNLIKTITELDETYTPAEALDIAIIKLNENKNTTFPYLLSDMVPYGPNKRTRNYTVTDSRNVEYPITAVFNPAALSNTAVLVYRNGTQLLLGTDYTFSQYDASVILSIPVVKGDVLVIEEYKNTDGCYVPPTPSKLGLYPKFEPTIYLDTSYSNEPVNVIQGHDGSLVVAFNDYRDAIIVEFEKRIFNNIKTEYNADLFDINTVLPGVFRNEEHSYSSLYSIIQTIFLKWTGFYGVEYEDNTTYSIDNHKTYNFKSATDYIFNKPLPGSWRAIYKYYFDTDRPNTHPWEMLGLSIKPTWWDSYYGQAPYTAGNAKLWADLEAGRIAQGANAGINVLYARPGLSSIIPVDDRGDVIDPRNWASIAQNDSIQDTDQSWAFGDWGPAENAWRRSSNWPFALQVLLALTKPADYASKLFDTSRMSLNNAGQYVYGDNTFITPSKLVLHSDVVNSATIRTAGYSVFVVEFGKIRNANYVTSLKSELANGNFNLFTKLGGFVSKDKLSIAIDASQPGTLNPSPFLPSEDYSIHFNVSNPIKTIAISGIVVIKSNGKFIVRGYDKKELFFNILAPIHQYSDSSLSVGDVSADFVTWTPGQIYIAGQIVFNTNTYYRVISDHKASAAFESKYYHQLTGLPNVGGLRVSKATTFESTPTIVSYGTAYSSIQEVYDFLSGYSEWLTSQGFVFDDYNTDFAETINWDFTAREFMYWTTQNWADNSVITLSPFASSLKFTFQEGVVDNIFDSFYEYSLLRADGLAFPVKNFNLLRDENKFVITPKNTAEGLFFARLNLVQKEHALVFNNTTIFSDVLYDISTGYRQLRIKLKGFETSQWNGDFFSPGFIYDNASITSWKQYSDYQPGDLVEYVGKYYSAKNRIVGTESFDFKSWILLNEKPQAQLLPNFEYKISQFEDFYSLDIDNFDLAQQKMAQHLIGYSPRNYLENIFDNPISQYKFYQGFIKEKGTKNTLTKLEKASVANLQGRIEFNEEWAFRAGYFGSYSSFNEIELPLRERDFIENNQAIQFIDSIPAETNNFASYVLPSDLTIKPTKYVSTQTFMVSSSTYLENNLVLPHAGYVRLDDVTYTVASRKAILDIEDTSVLREGDKFWVGFEDNGDWNVYRYSRQLITVITVEEGTDNASLKFTTNKYHKLKVGDMIAVAKMDTNVDGVFTVKTVPELNQFTVDKTNPSVQSNTPPGVLFKFTSVRFDSVDQIADLPYLADVAPGELFWVDDNGTGKWTTYKKIDNYDTTEFIPSRIDPGQQFGFRIAKQESSSTVIVSANIQTDIGAGYGRVYVYETIGTTLKPTTNYGLNDSTDEFRSANDDAGFGDVIFYDETDDMVFAAAPNASGTRRDPTGTVKYARPGNYFSSNQYEGLVKISGLYRGHSTNRSEIPFAVLVNPSSTATSNLSKFGSSIHVQRALTNKRVLIGAPGENTGTGAVYRFDVSISAGDRNYYGITGTNSAGTGATFDISIVDRSYTVTLANTGTNYTTSTYGSSRITIRGDQLGGTYPSNNLIVVLGEINANGSITSIHPAGGLNDSSTGTAFLKAFSVTSTSSQTKITSPVPVQSTEFGYKIAGDKDSTVVAVSAPGYDQNTGAVFVYTYSPTTNYTLVQTILGSGAEYNGVIEAGDRFGTELVMNDGGDYLFVASELAVTASTRPGKVGVYKWNKSATKFDFIQLLENPSKKQKINFGHSIDINSAGDILAITSQGDAMFNSTSFDRSKTTFDSDACRFGEVVTGSGTVYVYNRYNEKFLIAQELFDPSIDAGSFYGSDIAVNNHTIYIGSPSSVDDGSRAGSVFVWNETDPDLNSWNAFREQSDLVDISLIKKAATVDTLSQQVVDYLDVIDPLKGKIAGIADQEIRYKTLFDPAVYSQGDETVAVNADGFWSTTQVGDLWWDLSTVKFIWYEQGDLAYRKNTWGQIFPGASVDVYEWVETEYLPSQWASLADTTTGLTANISGQPKFTDDTVYSSKQIFDKNTNQFTTLYYYWVKNKAIVPQHDDRRISAYEVASLIVDPKLYGLKYLTVIASDSVSVVNLKSDLLSDRIYLNISYDTINSDINKHTEWVLVQENGPSDQLPALLEKKLIDSLLGRDSLSNPVPDPTLPARLMYGIEIRPRQSMFVNRYNALRNLIDYTNTALKSTLTSDYINFSNLNAKEEIPDILVGEYDEIYESVEGRDTVITEFLKRAELTCGVTNGRLTSVIITEPGFGYKVAPTINFLNVDTDAKLKATIDSNGSITGIEIVNPGSGFVTPPELLVRGYTVVVSVDPDFANKWSKYEWDGSWIRIHTQKFDTTRYWKYIDWVDASFNTFKSLSHTVEEMYEVHTLQLSAGEYVKVNNPGNGKYIILRKSADGVAGTFSTEFDIVYSEEGTIQILESVWNPVSAQLGYDDNTTFDQLVFDETADVELSNILTAIKQDIFTGSLRGYWNKFFFKAVKFALTEQRFLDWAFKTSFINVRNIAGVLDQRITYRFQDPTWYEDYLKEVKPYHTQIRNYQVNYQVGSSLETPWEASGTYTTDFDLPAVFDNSANSFITVSDSSTLMNEYPHKAWAENYKFSIGEIILATVGSGYRTVPKVDIIAAPGDSGTGATAKAYISFGRVTSVELLTQGTGYTKIPTVVISGGGDNSLTPATAYVRLSNNKVRSNFIGMKFDRIAATTSTFVVGDTTYRETITAPGNKYKFTLTWYASAKKSDVKSITLDGITILPTDFSIEQRTEFNGEYHKKYSDLVLSFVPGKSKEIIIEYTKNIEIYSAAERVRDYYSPTEGMPGTDLGQVMMGVDYPGVNVTGLPFASSAYWDVLPFGNTQWGGSTSTEDLSLLDTVIDGGDLSFNTARGLEASDIILDGDGFVTPNTSHAPEELVPGQVDESVSISVFTKEPSGSPMIATQSSLISSTSTSTVVGLRLQPANTSSVMVSLEGKSLNYGTDYLVDFINKTVTVKPQSTLGTALITIVGVGGEELVGSRAVMVSSTSTAIIDTVALYSTIGSVYVTVNGEATTNYTLSTISSTNNKGRLTVNGITSSTAIVQTWFFRPVYKAYSEVKEQIVTLETGTTTVSLLQTPGTLGPFHAQAVVELNGIRLTPPDTVYYRIADNQTTFDIQPDEVQAVGYYSIADIEVHVNGIKQTNGVNFALNQPDNKIIFNTGVLNIDDVLAITVLLNSDYIISNGELILTSSALAGDVLKIITYTNHDASKIRTEVFRATASKYFNISRPVVDISYVWVSINGQSLVPGDDFAVLNNKATVKVKDTYNYPVGAKVVITTFGEVIANSAIGYRIFKDLLGRTHYKRYSNQNTTVLTQPLYTTSTLMYVENAEVLPVPVAAQNAPGIVFVAGERIEYFTKVGNVLGQLRRGTLGTTPKLECIAGTAVIDQGRSQTIPFSDTVIKEEFTSTTTATVAFTLTNMVFVDTIDATDQIEVYYAGRMLSKVPTYYHNVTVSSSTYDTLAGTNRPAEFSIVTTTTTSTSQLVIAPYLGTHAGASVVVIQRKSASWYSLNSTNSLLQNETVQAQFLLERQSGLPDKYQYGQL